MLRAIRINALQQMPNYRKPASFIIKESYPLPPYSSVIGLIHTLCGWTGTNRGYRPMRVSIQGTHAGTVSDYATNYAFGSIPLERAALKVPLSNDKFDGVARMPRSYELLTDVELVLHIIPEDDALVEEIADAFKNPPVYPSLGRYEDVLQINTVEIVELESTQDRAVPRLEAYVPTSSIHEENNENITGTIYRLGKVFDYEGKDKMRVWKESVMVRHICANKGITPARDVYIDTNFDEAVFPA